MIFCFSSPETNLSFNYDNRTFRIEFSVSSAYLVSLKIYEHRILIFSDPSLSLKSIDIWNCIYFVRTIFDRVKLYHQAYHFRQSISDYHQIAPKLKLNVNIPPVESSQLNSYLEDIFMDFQSIVEAFQTNLEVDIFAENILKKLRNLFLALSIFKAVFYDEQYSSLRFCDIHFENAMYNTLLIEADELDRQYRLLFDNKYLFLKELDAIEK